MIKLLTAQEVARLLGMSESQVYALGRSGILPVIRIGRSIRIADDQLQDWIEHGGQAWPGGWRKQTP